MGFHLCPSLPSELPAPTNRSLKVKEERRSTDGRGGDPRPRSSKGWMALIKLGVFLEGRAGAAAELDGEKWGNGLSGAGGSLPLHPCPGLEASWGSWWASLCMLAAPLFLPAPAPACGRRCWRAAAAPSVRPEAPSAATGASRRCPQSVATAVGHRPSLSLSPQQGPRGQGRHCAHPGDRHLGQLEPPHWRMPSP